MGITCKLNALPGRGAGRPGVRGVAAGDGQRLRDDRQRRLPQHADGDHQGRLPRRPASTNSATPSARRCSATGSPPRRPTSSSRTSSPGPAPPRNIGCPAAGKTGTTDDFTRRVVRRLHPQAGHRGLGRLPQPADLDDPGRPGSPSRAARSRHRSGRTYMKQAKSRLRRLPDARGGVRGHAVLRASTRPPGPPARGRDHPTGATDFETAGRTRRTSRQAAATPAPRRRPTAAQHRRAARRPRHRPSRRSLRSRRNPPSRRLPRPVERRTRRSTSPRRGSGARAPLLSPA